ncbi:MAG: hypothetical protein QGH57_04225 [Candidatus Thalassarchaeaceae archaeon]|jgi:DhnA family fructose-bisphosphate aldolase class Ia|nr:fructose-bisphosphate aldolase [Euryarchaeota archaeon]MDP7091966.1 hypothetical protein [Candidatus Thalassarchaeaceae archaeon]MBV43707.1 fructose-bisphosphate aldolase [Euryarchaeota archaeon]MDP7257218.1 hypothetical protein [Candidatus Thalassarchaeaceae archaeon]MDP7648746.1 hypothetical protein [Candidatus Thalassarchaeaceae archaeon]|tara:strand:+ start:2566 stop:3360 length:795 start_codon:yes stop_codon:yes gene_type:complete
MAETLSERLERLLPGGRGVWVPMDHGASRYPEAGLGDTDAAVDAAIAGGADAVVLQKGAVSHHVERTGWGGFVCHVSASTVHGGSRSQDKVSVATAGECLSRGASGLSAQINLGEDAEADMIERMGSLTSDAHPLGLPVLGMAYPRGPNLVLDPTDSTHGIAHAVRLAWELGCHIAKVPWTGSPESFSVVVSAAPIPVLIAGGPRGADFTGLLGIVEQAMGAGGAGVCIGRQVFGAEDPAAHVRALSSIVHNGESASEAASHLG